MKVTMRTMLSSRCFLLCSVALNVVLLFAFFPAKWDIRLFSKRRTFHVSNRLPSPTTKTIVSGSRDTTPPPTSKTIVSGSRDNTPPQKNDEDCPAHGRQLLGLVKVNLSLAEENYWTESKLEKPKIYSNESTFLGRYDVVKEIQSGYFFSQPEECRPQHTVAFIIPFRDREAHLRILLGHLVPILRRQLIRYSIFVVEQSGNTTFNKGRLMDTAFQFAAETGKRSETPYDCFIFHDVDILSEDDTLMYRCPEGNKVGHLSTTIDIYAYHRMCCGITIGGVLAVKEEQFLEVNGFPISYWGWGGEDDDMHRRIGSKKIAIVRPQPPLGRFSMIPHKSDEKNPKNPDRRILLSQAVKRMKSDGLVNLQTEIVRIEKFPLFTKIVVDVGHR